MRRSIQSHSTTGTSSTRSASSSSKVSVTLGSQSRKADNATLSASRKSLPGIGHPRESKTHRSLIPRCRNTKFENTKSRYLEPKPVYKSTSDLATTQAPISSGESSRNISPAMRRAPPFVNKNDKSHDTKSSKQSEPINDSETSPLKTHKPIHPEKIMRNLSETKVPKLLSSSKTSLIPAAVHKSAESINTNRTTKDRETNARQVVKNTPPVKHVSRLSKMPVVDSKNKVPLKKTNIIGTVQNNSQLTKSPVLDTKKIQNNKSLADKKIISKVNPKVCAKATTKLSVKSKSEEQQKDVVKPRHSFYNPTQSTKAKTVSQPNIHESKSATNSQTKNTSKPNETEIKNTDQTLEEIFEANQKNIPIMERSGTFLKDEPTVIDKYITSDSTVEMYPKQ